MKVSETIFSSEYQSVARLLITTFTAKSEKRRVLWKSSKKVQHRDTFPAEVCEEKNKICAYESQVII